MDIHEDFINYPLTLSVHRQSQLRPTIIIGQDKSVFKRSVCLANNVGLVLIGRPNYSPKTKTIPKLSQHLC